MLCFVSNGEAKLISRNGKEWTDKFPGIVKALEALGVTEAVFDGEAVILDAQGRSNFQSLQAALGDGGDTSAIEIYLFDLLHLNGADISSEPLYLRKEKLKALLAKLPNRSAIHYSDHLSKGEAVLSKACKLGLEGLISKDRNAAYEPGRSKSWLKSKCIKRQEFVIVGYTPPRRGNRALGALHIGYMERGKLTYASKVGTGFDYKMAEQMLKMLKPIAGDHPPMDTPRDAMRDAIWVKPKYLCEVSFTEWTNKGGLRHPSFEGLRMDKQPDEVKKEKPMPVKQAVKAEKATKKPVAHKAAGATTKNSTYAEVLGVTITHPEREVFVPEHVTKIELAEYYAAAAPFMLAQMKKHPISLLRCPGGAGKQCFFQRNPDDHMKKHIKPFPLEHGGKDHEYLYVEDAKGIVFLAQMGVIEIHPWGSSVDNIKHPDYMVFDLDPDEAVPFDAVKLGALDLRKRLKKLGLESFVKCTGGKGLHVTVPLAGKDSWEDVRAFSEKLSHQMVGDVPEAYIATMSKAKRHGKIFIDYFRNNYTASAIADYAVRARPGAPVAVPLQWAELKKLKSAHEFTLENTLARLKKLKPGADERYKLMQRLPKLS